MIPVYNVERYLEQCIGSVLDQVFDDYEIILVNDGSTDCSLSICESYVEKNPSRFKLVSQENSGLLKARRRGFKETSGQYVLSLDSDDMLRNDALLKINKKIEETSADLICFEGSRKSDFSSFWVPPLSDNELYFSEDQKDTVLRIFCRSHKLKTIWSKAVKRDCLHIEDSYECYESIQYGEDLLQCSQIMDSIKTMAYIPETLYYYRLNMGSLSNKHYRGRFEECHTVREVNLRYAEKWAKEYNDDKLVPGVLGGYLRDIYVLFSQAVYHQSYNECKPIFSELQKSSLIERALEFKPKELAVRIDCYTLAALLKFNSQYLAYIMGNCVQMARNIKAANAS